MASFQLLALQLLFFIPYIAAQSLSDLPQCGQACVSGQLAQAAQLGCSQTDPNQLAFCLCSKAHFGRGIRDCTLESCTPGGNIVSVYQYGIDYCQAAASSLGSASATLAAVSALKGATGGSSTSDLLGSSSSGGTNPTSSPASSAVSGSSSLSQTSSLSTSMSAGPITSSQASSALSSAAKVGIGVGAGLGVPILAAIFGVFLLRRRKAKRKAGNEALQQRFEKPELQNRELPRTTGRSELEDPVYSREAALSKITSKNKEPAELGLTTVTSELSGSGLSRRKSV